MKIKDFKIIPSGHIPVSWLIVLAIVFLLPGCQAGCNIENPYEQVDWSNHQQYKANLHTHTTRSDGWMAPKPLWTDTINWDITYWPLRITTR